jgi:PAS domain S-box-containing protein
MLIELDLRSRTAKASALFLPYVFGLSAVAAATMMALMAQPILGGVQPCIIYILPVMAAAAFGGLLPGLGATSTSALAIVLVFLPHGDLGRGTGLLLLLFLLDGLCISWLGKQMREAIGISQRVQKEIQDAHESQRRILGSISDAFGALDAQWRFIYVNRNLASLAGKAPEALVGEEVWAAIPAFCAEGTKQALRQALETRTAATFEMFVPQLNRWYETRVYPLESGLSLYSHDITARLDAERALRESEERLRLAPEAAMVGTWTNDFQNGQLLWSSELRRIFGLSSQPFARGEEAFLELIHPDDRNTVKEAFARCKEDQALFEIEVRYSYSTEDIRWMMIRGRGYVDEAGLPSRLVGIAIDVTVQKHHEEKLRHTQRLESLGVLAGGIAHDFNNLLLVIMGNADLASRLLPSDHAASAPLEEVGLACHKAANLTRQMLAYSGRGRVEVERLQVSTTIREIERLIRSVIPKNVEFKIDLSAELPFIKADAGQIQQVIMNLVINAAESIPVGRQGTVCVRAYAQCISESVVEHGAGEEHPPAGNYITIEVEDDGIGMSEATRLRIFEPFFTTKLLGRGLGLAAVLGIIRAHKGTLRVDSTPGSGTRFQVLMAAEFDVDRITPAEGNSPADLRGEGLILVVDDEKSVRQLAGNILETYGYSVIAAEDGYTAVEQVRRCSVPLALVLLDLSMPGMNTEQTIEQLRFFQPDLPVLLSSGYDESDVLLRLADDPLLGFVHKPYTPSQLAEKVKARIVQTGASSFAVGRHIHSIDRALV